jgi:hypothetical protein
MKRPDPSAGKRLLSGNEAIAPGAWEAGGRYAAAYPGTPNTEIPPALVQYAGVCAEWASNEKVALDAAVGASFAGARAGGHEARGRRCCLRQFDDPLLYRCGGRVGLASES